MDAVQTHEVIVISSDESDDEDVDSHAQLLQLADAADRLLLLAENRDLLQEKEAVTRLLQEMQVVPSRAMRNALQTVLSQLSKLLAFCHDHPRRHRACEELVSVICEVLSLAQTQEGARLAPFSMKEEEAATGYRAATMHRISQRIEPWVAQLQVDGETSADAIAALMARLEASRDECVKEIECIRLSLAKHGQEREKAAQEWLTILERCRAGEEREGRSPSDREIAAWKESFKTSTSSAVQATWDDHNRAYKALARRSHEQHLRREFFVAAVNLALLTAPLIADQDQRGQQEPLRGDLPS